MTALLSAAQNEQNSFRTQSADSAFQRPPNQIIRLGMALTLATTL